MINVIRKKLSRLVLTILTIVVCITMATVTYMTAYGQEKNMIKEMTTFGNELSYAVYGSLRYTMSVGDSLGVKKQLLDMREKLSDVEILICDTRHQVVYATHEQRLGTDIGKVLNDKSPWPELTESFNPSDPPRLTFEERSGDQSHLVTLNLVANEKECHHCHGEGSPILGAIMVRMPTDRTYATIAGARNRNIVISLLGIGAIIGLTYAMLFKLVTQPVQELAGKMKKLPERIAAGDYIIEPDVTRNDEIGNLLTSFNHMGEELESKSQMLKKTNTELESAYKELEAFAYSVSHDLRAPLRNIDGFSKILLDEYALQLDDLGKRYLERVRAGTVKMSVLIDDMLMFSRAGRVELQLRPTSANLLFNNALRDFSEEISKRDVRIRAKDMPQIFCDPNLIQNVLANVISNSIKYSKNTEQPEIEAGFDGPRGALYIKDNGVGFDMKYHDKIFQVFQRLHLPEEYEGTGIGLAVVKRIVERHHGSIWAESEPGKGATFFIKLPLSETQQPG